MLLSAHHADQIVVPSEAMRSAVLDWAPELASKCLVNPYGTLIDIYRPQGEQRQWRSDGVLRLLYVSVYYPHKNPSLVCEAVRLLNEAGIRAHATITMDLDELRRVTGSDLDRLQMEAALRRGEITLGHHRYDRLPDLYRNHDIFVFPSVSETFGHPMVEALSSGTLIAAAETAVNQEICGDAATYFKPFSSRDLFERLWMLDSDTSLRLALGSHARERALSLYKWSDHVDRLIEIFSAVKASAARGR